jgi:ketosteroid isomerase-like protein
MSATPNAFGRIDLGRYLAMRDCIMRIAWNLDRGDSAGVASCFTPDGTITTADGTLFEGAAGIRRFAATAARNPAFRGRQHHVTPLFVDTAAAAPVWTSYYQLLHFDAAATAPELLSLGYYRDRFAEHDGRLLVGSRSLLRWNAAQAPRGPAARTNPAAIGPGGPALGGPAPDDRAAIEALMHDYAAALDTGDLARMTRVFAPHGVLHSGGLGRLEGPSGLARFLAFNTRNPGFAGRQHRIFPVLFEPTAAGWRAFSYWKVETWAAGAPPRVLAIGYYEDEFSRHGGRWLTDSKTIRRWNSETAPMAAGWPEPA